MSKSNFYKVCKTEEMPPNTCKVFKIEGKSIAIYNSNGMFYAFDSECTHAHGPLCKGRFIIYEGKHYIQCPWHGATFDLENGEAKSGPTKKAINVYKIKIENNEILIEI